MAAASDSDDASDTFWPGYVDAVTNLAINLLFVIAVMSIVVLGTTLQLSKMKPKDGDGDRAIENKAEDSRSTIQAQAQTIAQLQQQLARLQQAKDAPRTAEGPLSAMGVAPGGKASAKGPAAEGASQIPAKAEAVAKAQVTADGSARTAARPEVVMAQQIVVDPAKGESQLQDFNAGGVVVVFAPDVIELADAEVTELVRKLGASAAIKGQRWELRVFAPRGFSEAVRLAYYRVSHLRNVLIGQGALSADIEMRVIETQGANADNARVLVRRLP